MPGSMITNSTKPYLKIIGGKIAYPSKQGEFSAVLREYELPNGDKGSKWEIPYLNWTGKIKSIRFKESDYGDTCNVEFEDAFLQLNTAGRYFQDFACKVFNADLSQPITFHPYDMEGDKGKKVTGVSLQQNGNKLKNFFYDFENKTNLYGFPSVDPVKSAKKTYWKIYFAEVAEFLTEKLGDLKFPELAEVAPDKTLSEAAEEIFSEPELSNLPF